MIKLYTLLICLITFGCKNQKEVTNISKTVDVVTIYESACEGSCPVYSMTIHADGTANFSGEAHTKKLGEHTYNFSKDAVLLLFQNLQKLNFETFKETESFMADSPETKLEYNNNSIIVKDVTKVPDDFAKVLIALKKLTRSSGFVN